MRRKLAELTKVIADPAEIDSIMEIAEAVGAAEIAGVELQHVDEIRYRVLQRVWESNGVSVDEFFRRVIDQIRAS